MKKTLITGGGGFIGSFLTKLLSQKKHEIVLIDACPPMSSSAYEMGLLSLPNVKYLQVDILDKEKIESLSLDFNYIIHAAGILGIKKVCEQPLLTADVNVFGTRNILELARRQKSLKRFVLFSTSEVYGQNAENVSEDSPSIIPNIGMRWVYASSKQFSEYLLKAFIQEYDVPGVIVRPFNVYGPFRKGSNAFTTLITRALENQEIYISGDGTQTRCWCYIEDFIQGVIQCLDVENIIGEAFNIGNPFESISMVDLAAKMCSLVGSQSSITILGDNVEDVRERRPDILKAQKILKYDPKVSLGEGIHHVAAWIKSQNAALV
jgi:nucleoside-diphosphate-sugar epimerase